MSPRPELRRVENRAGPGGKNIYTCPECGGFIVTVDRDDGVTPFMIPCSWGRLTACKGMMQSSMYRVFDSRMQASHEWYRPDAAEIPTLSPGHRDHVAKGGLLPRKIAEEKSIPTPDAWVAACRALDRKNDALRVVAEWRLPATGKFWDDDPARPMSYGACFGSDGERDFMRTVAKDALEGR